MEVKTKDMPPQPVKSKVVSIPVHFVGSEQRRSESVMKIQKVFKGCLVRKNMNKIKSIRDEVNHIELSISKKETVDSIRNDSKERLKINEMLMGLLLKLDSIRGVDSGVRDCRKSFIKKTIALQEVVDAIVSGDQSNDADDDQNEDTADHCNQTLESQDHDDAIKKVEFVSDFPESEVNQETVEPKKEAANEEKVDCGFDQNQYCTSAADHDDTTTEDVEVKQETTEPENEAAKEEKMERSGFQGDSWNLKEEEAKGKEDNGEKKRSMDMGMAVVEKMVEDNEKMMGLMTLLFQKNELQTRMLSALSQRVEQLEKAILCDKSRRKKRRSVADKK